MTEKPFRFKHFTIYHQQSTLKVSTDAILLGSWTNADFSSKILDIGCGSGILALMMAQKTDAIIDAIDIDFNSVIEAKKNASISKWSNRIHIQNIPFQDFIKDKNDSYDLIICNPPYFINSLKSNDPKKNLAKHNDILSFDELAFGISKLLKDNGNANLIFPVIEGRQFIEIAKIYNLYCNRETEIIPKKGLKSNRLLIKLEKYTQEQQKDSLCILDEFRNYTNEFKELSKDFYINI